MNLCYVDGWIEKGEWKMRETFTQITLCNHSVCIYIVQNVCNSPKIPIHLFCRIFYSYGVIKAKWKFQCANKTRSIKMTLQSILWWHIHWINSYKRDFSMLLLSLLFVIHLQLQKLWFLYVFYYGQKILSSYIIFSPSSILFSVYCR